MPERGQYIVLEGSDGAGKSTQLRALKARLHHENVPSSFTFEPGGSPIGKDIRRLLLNPDTPIQSTEAEIALFTAERAELWHTVIEPNLRDGINVISDRNWYSTLAYQVASKPELESTIAAVTSALLPSDYVTPNLAIVLMLSQEERKRRHEALFGLRGDGGDNIESRGVTYHEKVHRVYETLPLRLGARAIQADGTEEEVAERVWSAVAPFVA